jgi:hypothetical protein
MKCIYCQSSRLRFSHIQFFDFEHLFLLQMPLRCRSCQERFYSSIFRSWRLAFPKKSADGQARRAGSGAKVRDSSTAA